MLCKTEHSGYKWLCCTVLLDNLKPFLIANRTILISKTVQVTHFQIVRSFTDRWTCTLFVSVFTHVIFVQGIMYQGKVSNKHKVSQILPNPGNTGNQFLRLDRVSPLLASNPHLFPLHCALSIIPRISMGQCEYFDVRTRVIIIDVRLSFSQDFCQLVPECVHCTCIAVGVMLGVQY